MNFFHVRFKYIFLLTYILSQNQTKAALQSYELLSLDEFKVAYEQSSATEQNNHKRQLMLIAVQEKESVPDFILDKLEYVQLPTKFTINPDEVLAQQLLKNSSIQRNSTNPTLFQINFDQINSPESIQYLLGWICEKSPKDQCFNLIKQVLKICNVLCLSTKDKDGNIPEKYAAHNNPQIILFLQLYQKLYPKHIHNLSTAQERLYHSLCSAFKSFMLDDQPEKLNQLFTQYQDYDLYLFFEQKPDPLEKNYLLSHSYQNYVLLRSLIKSGNKINTQIDVDTIKFFHAIRDHEYEITEQMLNDGYNPNQQNQECDPLEYYGIYPIYAAITSGNIVVLKQLLKKGAHLTTYPFGHPNRNAAHFAIQVYFNHEIETLPRQPYLTCLDTLLQHSQTDINQPVPNTQKTLLEYAIEGYKANLSTIDYISFLDQQQHISDYLPSCIPVDPKFTLLSLLIKHGASLEQKTAEGKTLLQLTTKHKKLNDWIFDQLLAKSMSKLD